MANEESFLARWSRRKRGDPETRAAEERPPASPSSPAETSGTPAGTSSAAETPSHPDLPPLETLNKDSDYTVFMQAGVPEAMRQQALRKLWTSDPVLANLDGLLEYGEDFRAAFVNPGVVKTLYRVGKGMRDVLENDAPPADEASPVPVEQAAPAEAGSESESDGPAEEIAREEGEKSAPC
jgi:hypothetical protein